MGLPDGSQAPFLLNSSYHSFFLLFHRVFSIFTIDFTPPKSGPR